MAERGYASVLALALLMGGVLLVGLAADVARSVATWRRVSQIAHTAAEVGAGHVDSAALYDGRLVLDRDGAGDSAERLIVEAGLTGSVSVSPDRICARVESSVEPGIIRLIGAGPTRVAATACAEPRRG